MFTRTNVLHLAKSRVWSLKSFQIIFLPRIFFNSFLEKNFFRPNRNFSTLVNYLKPKNLAKFKVLGLWPIFCHDFGLSQIFSFEIYYKCWKFSVGAKKSFLLKWLEKDSWQTKYFENFQVPNIWLSQIWNICTCKHFKHPKHVEIFCWGLKKVYLKMAWKRFYAKKVLKVFKKILSPKLWT